jgi:cytochrome P450
MAAGAYDPQRAPRLDALVQEVLRLTPPVGGFFRRTTRPLTLAGVAVPPGRVVQVALAASNRYAPGLAAGAGDADDWAALDLESFRPQRHLEGAISATLLPFGGGERVCLGKALAELEIRLMVVGLMRRLHLELAPGQDLELQLLPSPTPRDGLLVQALEPPAAA